MFHAPIVSDFHDRGSYFHPDIISFVNFESIGEVIHKCEQAESSCHQNLKLLVFDRIMLNSMSKE